MIEINCHSSIKIIKGKTIYIDPFRIEKEQNDASLILITHDHYDHYSEEDIKKVINENTIVVVPKTMKVGINAKEVIYVCALGIYLRLVSRAENIWRTTYCKNKSKAKQRGKRREQKGEQVQYAERFFMRNLFFGSALRFCIYRSKAALRSAAESRNVLRRACRKTSFSRPAKRAARPLL